MHEISVTSEFAAAHAIRIAGEREPVHGHNWRVTAVIRGPRLDADGLLCDFHLIESGLRDIILPFHNHHLNEVSPFDVTNPTAERVAEHIATRLTGLLKGRIPADARVVRVTVTEAPGCEATHLPVPSA